MNKKYEIAKRICEENNIPPNWASAIIACVGGLLVDHLPSGYVFAGRAKELRE